MIKFARETKKDAKQSLVHIELWGMRIIAISSPCAVIAIIGIIAITCSLLRFINMTETVLTERHGRLVEHSRE